MKNLKAYKVNIENMFNDNNNDIPQWLLNSYQNGDIYYGQHSDDFEELFAKIKNVGVHVPLGSYIIKRYNNELFVCDSLAFETLMQEFLMLDK